MTTTPTPPEGPVGPGSVPVPDGALPSAPPVYPGGPAQSGEAAPPFPPPSFPQYGQGGQQDTQSYGQPYGDPYGGGFGAPPVQRRNGLGTAALVLGIISIPAAFLYIGLVCGVLAVVFGIIALKRVRQSQATNRGQAMAGLICGAIGTVIAILWIALVAWAFNKSQSCNDKYPDRSGSDYTQCVRDSITNG